MSFILFMVNALLDVLSAGEAFEFFLGSAFGVFVFELAALVVVGLATRESEFGLRLAALEVDAEHHERVATLLKLRREFPQFAFVQQESAIAHRIDVVPGSMFVRRDMDTLQRRFRVSHDCIAICQRAPAVAEALDLGAGQYDPRFVGFGDRVFVSRLAIGCNDLGHRGRSLAQERGARKAIAIRELPR